MQKILLVGYGGGHINMLLPVAKKLQELNFEVVFFALTTAIDKLNNSEFTYYTYKDFFYSDRVQKYGKELIKELETVKLDDEESIAYLGQNYLELVEKFGESEAKALYQKSQRQIFEPIKSMEYVLQQIKPDIIVSTNAPRSEKCVIQAAAKLNIKSIALIDLFAIRCVDWFKENSFASKVCVFSDDVKEYLVEHGRFSKDIIVTGNPVLDKLINLENKCRPKKNFRVLWASQKEPEYFAEFDIEGDPELPLKIEKKLLEIFKNREWELVIRNHPNEESREYPDFVEVSSISTSLVETLQNVDLVVTCTSTVGLEGVILGKELITIDMSVFTPTIPFSKYGYSKGVSSLDSLEENIMDVYNNRSCKLENKKRYDIKDATQNVVDVIINLLKEKQ